MATIKIKGRTEPISVSHEMGKNVKSRKFGMGVSKAEPTELVDLGEWAGEYGRIAEIVLEDTKTNYREKEREQERMDKEKWMAQAPHVKAQTVGWFKAMYASRMGDWSAVPSKEVLSKVVKIQEKLYTENPRLMPMLINSKEYGKLLPPGKMSRLAEKMRVV